MDFFGVVLDVRPDGVQCNNDVGTRCIGCKTGCSWIGVVNVPVTVSKGSERKTK
jgi:hypothetical protein